MAWAVVSAPGADLPDSMAKDRRIATTKTYIHVHPLVVYTRNLEPGYDYRSPESKPTAFNHCQSVRTRHRYGVFDALVPCYLATPTYCYSSPTFQPLPYSPVFHQLRQSVHTLRLRGRRSILVLATLHNLSIKLTRLDVLNLRSERWIYSLFGNDWI